MNLHDANTPYHIWSEIKTLSFKERSQIELLKEQGHSNRAIARMLGRSPQTIHNEIKRGTIKQIRQQKQNGKVYKWYYSKHVAEVGQESYKDSQVIIYRYSSGVWLLIMA